MRSATALLLALAGVSAASEVDLQKTSGVTTSGAVWQARLTRTDTPAPCDTGDNTNCILHSVWIANQSDQPISCTVRLIGQPGGGAPDSEAGRDSVVPARQERAVLRRLLTASAEAVRADMQCNDVRPEAARSPVAEFPAARAVCQVRRVGAVQGFEILTGGGGAGAGYREFAAEVEFRVPDRRAYPVDLRLRRGSGAADLDRQAMLLVSRAMLETNCPGAIQAMRVRFIVRD